eukprot:scaffold2782_cov145-Skeletonema_menzelii.AAC.1
MSGDDFDLGLNLVFTNPASSSTTTASNSQKKRKNKYDRRRERGRQAKEAKKFEKANDVDSKTDDVGRPGNRGNQKSETDSTAASMTKNASDLKKAMNDDTDVTTRAEPGNKDDTSKNKASKVGGKKIDAISEDSAADKIAAKEVNDKSRNLLAAKSLPPKPVTTSKPISRDNNNGNTATSRRHRPETSLDEEERSKYLSEFHARPRDLDRTERASKNIKVSVASDHIFGTSNEEDGSRENAIIDDEGGAENETKGVEPASSCPFRKIGVHSNL